MIDANINEKFSISFTKYLFRIITSIITLLVVIFITYALKVGLFNDKTILINYIAEFGICGPITFIILQILQVIIPIIPGGISSLVGVLAFGPLKGFIYNYMSLVIGACVVYYLSNKYGLNLAKKFFKEKTINKYLKYLNDNTFEKIFLVGIIMPGFPDDLLCYIAGFSKLEFSRFITIILIGKPISLLFYSLLF